jgi:hypothetical protein
MARHRCCFYKTGKRLENSPFFARMLQSITRVSPFGLIADHLGKPQGAQNIAGARHAPADSSRDLPVLRSLPLAQYGDHGKGHRVAEETA